MKKRRIIGMGGRSALRTLRDNARRFLSILMIVALGAGFMGGLQAASPDMYDTADRYFDDRDLYDLDLKAPLGFTDEDARRLLALDCIERVQPARVMDLVLTDGEGNGHTARVFAILDSEGGTPMDRPALLTGRFPENSGECVIQTTLSGYDEHPLREGAVLTPEAGSMVRADRITVVGTVDSPLCISLVPESTTAGTGSIALNVFVTQDLFGMDRYTDLFAAVTGAKEKNTFSSAYTDLVADAAGEAGALAPALQAALADARQEGLKRNSAALAAVREKDPALGALLSRVGETKEERARGTSFLVLDRGDSAGYESYRSNVGKVAALAGLFPAFFFLVALLVALTAMTRLIDEKRTEIGIRKAMGVSPRGILGEYLFYALVASVPGSLLGLAAGFWLFPMAISNAYGMMFFLPPTLTPFRCEIAAWVAPVTVGSIVAAALLACAGEAAARPAALLRPKAPVPGKRILLESVPFLWRRLSFLRKVTARNLFRYKKRFLMTVVGIMGCTALLLTGFGLRDSVNDIVAVQFREIDRYQVTVFTDPAAGQEELDALLADPSRILDHAAFSLSTGRAVNGDRSASVTLTLSQDPEAFGRFITLRDRRSHRALPLEDGSAGQIPVVMTEKQCAALGLKTGDRFVLENAAGHPADAVLAGIAENYLEACAYLTGTAYRTAFGETPAYSAVLCATAPGTDTGRLTADLLACPGVVYASAVEGLEENFSQAIRGMDGVVIVLLLAAGALCMVVLYNLISINLCERRKELATLSVLGCFEEEKRRYLFRETDLLTLLGALCGILPGYWLHGFVVRTVEIDQVMFGRAIHPESILLSLGITLLFGKLCSLLMRPQLDRIDMVEAMKAGE